MPDMTAISVNLPHLSTVNLPDAPITAPGYSTGMDIKVLLSNIDRLIKAQETTQNAISARAKRPDAIRNLRRGNSWTLDILDDIAKALDVPAWELLRPPGAIPPGLKEIVREIIREEANPPPPEPVAAPRKRKKR